MPLLIDWNGATKLALERMMNMYDTGLTRHIGSLRRDFRSKHRITVIALYFLDVLDCKS